MFKTLQKIGKAFMLPIAILPAAGLLLGIGGALSNQTTILAYPVLDNHFLQSIFQVMAAAGTVVFANLALLLCIGLGIGLANRDKGTAALAAVVGYLIMVGTISALLKIFTPDASGIDTGVIGALVMGLTAVWLHNRYHNIQLPQMLGFSAVLALCQSSPHLPLFLSAYSFSWFGQLFKDGWSVPEKVLPKWAQSAPFFMVS